MKKVRAKKQLGQHFLTDLNIAKETVAAFNSNQSFKKCIEVGPGMGVLTQFLLDREDLDLHIIDIDKESIEYLKSESNIPEGKLISGDFLKLDLLEILSDQEFGIIGNFPYNISTEILFKMLEHKNKAIELVGMFQKEVAERVVAKPGSKIYGITSVLIQAWYEASYLFTVDEDVFSPPPKVKSAVIRLSRNAKERLSCNEKEFNRTVKMAFNQRRKTLRNSLKSIIPESLRSNEVFNKRPEQLSVSEFENLVNMIFPS